MLLAVNNAANSVARVTTGLLADYVGRQNTMIACVSTTFPLLNLCSLIAQRLPNAGLLLWRLGAYVVV